MKKGYTEFMTKLEKIKKIKKTKVIKRLSIAAIFLIIAAGFSVQNYSKMLNGLSENGSNLPASSEAIALAEEVKVIPMASSGYYHSLVLKEDGTVWGFGSNVNKQLGDATMNEQTYTTRPTPIYITEDEMMTNIKMIGTGELHSAALTIDGEVYTWGDNTRGQLGDGTTVASGTPTKVELPTKIISLIAWFNRTVALDENGEVYVWGEGYTSTPQKLAIDKKVIQITGDAVLTEDKEVYTFRNLTTPVAGLENIVQIAASANNSYTKAGSYIALREDGKIYTWGANNYGQLGNGSTSNNNTPALVKDASGTELSHIVEVHSDRYGFIVRTQSGEIYSWGQNEEGEAGTGVEGRLTRPAKATDVTGMQAVSDSQGYTHLLIDSEGYVWVCGYNNYGQLGIGTTTDILKYQRIDGEEFTAKNYEYKIRPQESINLTKNDFEYVNEFNVYTNGGKQIGNLSFESKNPQIAEVDSTGKVTAIAEGTTRIIVTNSQDDSKTEVVINVTENITNIDPMTAAGYYHSLVLKSDGTVWGFGSNAYGQLGNYNVGTTILEPTPIYINGNERLTNIKMIGTGNYHSIALTNDGEVYTWGYNIYGELGIGNTQNSAIPTKVDLPNKITSVMAWEERTVALDENGDVYVWGQNYGTTPQRLKTSRKAIQITGNAILTEDREVYTFRNLSSPVAGLEDIVTIAASADNQYASASYLALKSDGKIYAWGGNNYGQLGNGSTSSNSTPTSVKNTDGTEFNNIVEIHSTRYGFIVKTDDGEIYSWGINEQAETGNGNKNHQTTPFKAPNIPQIETMANTQGYTNVLMDKEGYVWVCGWNNYGQLGDGTTTNSYVFKKLGSAYIEFDNRQKFIRIGEEISTKISSVITFNLYNKSLSTSNLTYKSSDEDIATVDDNGNIQGKAKGEVTITATNEEGDSARCIISVISQDNRAITLPSVTTIGHTSGSTNRHTTIILKEDGTVWTVGNNEFGQLGRGTIGGTSNELAQVKISENTYLTDVVKISGNGSYSVLALTKSGEVYAWGEGTVYQLGQGTDATNKGYATKVPNLNNIIDIDMTYYHAAKALAADGDVYTWGGSYSYLVGDSFSISGTPQKLTSIDNVVDISTAYLHVMMLKGDGTVWTHGEGDYGRLGNGATSDQTRPVQVETADGFLENIIKIEAVDEMSTAIDSDGNYYAWGNNSNYQLGNGANANLSVATKIDLPEDDSKVIKIGGSNDAISYLAGSGKIYVVGYNGYGQLSQGNTETVTNWTTAKAEDGSDFTDVFTISGGEKDSFFAIKNNGTVWAAGYNREGQLGTQDTASKTYLTQVGKPEFTAKNFTYKIKPNESIVIEKDDFEYTDQFNVLVDAVKEIGDLSFESLNPEIASVDSDTGKITGIKEGTARIKITNKLYGDEAYILVKVSNFESGITPMLAAGYQHTLGLKADGTVWAFGSNLYGQIGNNTNRYVTEPTPVLTADGSPLENIQMIGAGNYHSIALTTDGKVYTWGYNGYGELGNGTKTNTSIPTDIALPTKIVSVIGWEYRTIALDEYGDVYVWGENYGTTPQKLNTPNTVIQITGDAILTADRKVYTFSNLTTPISGLQNIVEIAASANNRYAKGSYLALRADGKVYAWGGNNYGQLGNGTTSANNTPTLVKNADGEEFNNIVEVHSNRYGFIIRTIDGEIYSWGINEEGEVGNNTEVRQTRPAKAIGVENIETMANIQGYTNALMDMEGYVWTSGWNNYGQLGIGSTTDKLLFNKIGDAYIEPSENEVSMYVGNQKEITANAKNSFNLKQDIIETELTYHIVDENIANYSNGYITAKAVGTTYLVIKSEELDEAAVVKIEVLPDGAKAIPDVQAGSDFTTALKANGTVWTWGKNTYGQLGTGDTTNKNEPNQVAEITEIVKQISVEDNHTIALTENGEVYAWGYNGYGQCGNGTTSNVKTPVKVKTVENSVAVDLSGIVKIKAGKNVSFAVDKNFNLWAWGQGYGKYAVKVTKVENVIDITKEYVLTADQKVYRLSDMSEIETVEKIIAINEGYDHTVILTENGGAYAIGKNTYGQLGNGTTEDSLTTVVGVREPSGESLLTNIKDIRAGNGNTIAITNDNKVYIWGLSTYGKSGQQENTSLPVEYTKLNNSMIVSAGYNHTVIANKEGFVWDFGLGTSGQLGNKENEDSTEPVLVGTYNITTKSLMITIHVNEETELGATIDFFNLLIENGTGLEYKSYNETIANITPEGILTGVSEGRTYIEVKQSGTDNTQLIIVEVLKEGQIAKPQVKTNGSHTIILKANGTVWSFGQNTYGQLGDGSYVAKDGTVKVSFEENTKITQIDAGKEHNIALDTEGNVWTWGRNSNGQLGVSGSTSNVPVKVDIPEKVVKVAAGNNYSLAIGESGTAYGWGFNENGELGIGTYKTVSTPTKIVNIEKAIDISGGNNHSLLVTNKGKVYATGNNTYGQLGLEEQKVNVFKEIEGVENIVDVDAGDSHSIGLTVNGDVYVWGSNIYGQLGLDDRQNRNTPVKVEDKSNIISISAGKANSMLLENTGKIYLTGANSYGEIGDGTTVTRQTFVEIAKIPDAIEISTGETYSLAIRKDGTVWGWGDYNHGAPDTNSKTESTVPVIIGTYSALETNSEIILKTSQTKNIGISSKEKFNVFYDNDKEPEDYTYESLNPEIADVNEEGIIIGVKVGKTRVIATDKETQEKFTVIVIVIENNKTAVPQIEGGDGFTVGLKSDGTIWTWGYNPEGALGDGTYETALVPKRANVVSTYTDISVGKDFALAKRADGTIWAWGSNSNGQLGVGSHKNAPKLVQVHGINNVKLIAAGANHSVVVDDFGVIYGWGSNSNGQLGLSSKNDVIEPTIIAVPEGGVISLAAGNGQTAYVTSQGEVYGLGTILNGKIPDLSNAIKVKVGDNYLLILTADGNIYEYSSGVLNQIQASNVVDITANEHIRMYQDKDGRTYTWGSNRYGELGTNDIASKSQPTKVSENGENTFNIGAGYDNSYIIQNDGFVYASGRNNHGQLGNSMQDDSLTHTLVGDRNFEINPDNIIMTVNDVKDLEIKSTTFNVFDEEAKKNTEYEWTSTDDQKVSVNEGTVTAHEEGTVTITAKDKLTGVQKQALIVVMPIDEQRIDTITVDANPAKVSGDKQYSVTISTDKDVATLKIETIDKTDKISIDGGLSYVENGSLIKEINVPDKVTTLPFKVQTVNGTIIDYTLEITKLSKNANLQELTVNGNAAIPTSGTTYEVVVEEDVDLVDIAAVTEHSEAMVSINGEAYQINSANYQMEMDELVINVPITVKAESGDTITYMLTVYKKSALIDLENITVNGENATRTSQTSFNAVIERDADISEIIATTFYEEAEVSIDGKEAKVHVSTEQVQTTEEATEVLINVYAEYQDEVLSREYTLTIYKERENAKLDLLIVNNTTIIPTGNTYIAYVPNSSSTAEVRVITALDTDKIKIEDVEEGIHDITKIVQTPNEENTYRITIVDGETQVEQNYTLIIRKPNADNSIKEIIGQKDNFQESAILVQNSDNEYNLKVPASLADIDLNVIASSIYSKVSINDGEFSDSKAVENILLTGDTTIVKIVVQAENGVEKEYTVNIIKLNDDTSLKQVLVDGIQAIPSDTEENTYNITLDKPLTEVEVVAETTNANSQVSIDNGAYFVNIAAKTITMDSKDKQIKIIVKSESGTIKEYYLNILGLPDNTNATYTVDDEEGVFVNEENKYVFKVNAKEENHILKAVLEDKLAKIQLGDMEETTQEAVMEFTNDDIGKQFTAVVTAQNGSKETVILEIQAKSSDTEIANVSVNGKILTADETGNYSTTVNHDVNVADIFIKLNDEYATVRLENTGDSEQANMGVGELNYELPVEEGQVTLTIRVTAEDGTEKTSNLTITKLNGNTNIQKITIDGNEVTKNDEGIYYYVMERKDSAELVATAESQTSTVTIGEDEAAGTITATLDTSLEETTCVVVVTAEDGTEENYTVVIRKISNDTLLEKVMADGVDASNISVTGESSFEIKVPVGTESINLTAIARSEYSSIKLSSEDDLEYNLKQMTRLVELNEDRQNTEIKLTVKAENGDLREYTVVVIKVNSLEIESVKANDEEALFSENMYTASIARNDETNIKISTVDKSTKIELLKNGVILIEKNGYLETNVDTIEETTNLQIRVTLQDNSESATYDLILNKKSNENGIEIVSVDSEVTQTDESGVYQAEIANSKDTVNVYVKAIDPNASIQINGDSSIKVGENTIAVPVDKDVDKQEVEIIVTAEDGSSKTYTLTLTLINDDNSLEYVKTDNVEADNVEGAIYESVITPATQNVQVEIKANDENATIVFGDTSENGMVQVNVDTIDEITEKTFDVISEYGTKKTYTLRIRKQSSDNTLKQVLVNGVEANKQEDGSYYISVSDLLDNVNVTAITNNDKCRVQIDGGIEAVNTATANVVLEEKVTEITIYTTSETGAELQTKLVIEKKSAETGIELITVDDHEVTEYNEATHTYTTTVEDTRNESSVIIMAKSKLASISLEDETEVGTLNTLIALNETGAEVKFTVTAEDGTEQEYTLVIVRTSHNTDLELVQLNDRTISPKDEELGIYEEIIPNKSGNAKIRVKTVDTYASIRIGDEEIAKGDNTVNISLNLSEEMFTIPVVITAQDEYTVRTYNIILKRGSDNTDITKVTVESEEIPCVEDTYTAIVKGSKEEAEVTITLSDANATAMLNGASGKGSLTVTVPLEGITTTKEIRVIAEDGTTKTYTLVINKYTGIEGSVITENAEDKHIALVQVYKTSDTRPIDDEDNPRELIASGVTNEDGKFDIMVPEVDKYDVVITKLGYLDYTVTDIETVEGESSDIGEKELIAGDVVKSGQIEIDDLVTIVDNYGAIGEISGEVETEAGTKQVADVVKNGLIEGKTAEEIYEEINKGGEAGTTVTEEEIRAYAEQIVFDLNEDGVIDSKDREIIKKNYDKVDVEEKWENREIIQNSINVLSVDVENNVLSGEATLESVNNVENQEQNSVLSGVNILSSGNTESTGTNKANSKQENSNNSDNNTVKDKSTQTPNEMGFIKPMDCEYEMTSEYGYRIHPITGEKSKHTGIDISGIHHTNIYAVADGEVTYAGVQSGYGNCIEIKHELADGTVVYSFYGHLSEIDVKVGEKVSVGDKIGLEGGDPETDQNAGSSTGHHLHFEIRTQSGYGYDVDPGEYIEF